MCKFKMKLAKFLAKEGIKKSVLAQGIDVSAQTISSWFWENRKPQYETAKKLVEFSKGYIKMKDCGHERP